MSTGGAFISFSGSLRWLEDCDLHHNCQVIHVAFWPSEVGEAQSTAGAGVGNPSPLPQTNLRNLLHGTHDRAEALHVP